jgi:hypothetical protein
MDLGPWWEYSIFHMNFELWWALLSFTFFIKFFSVIYRIFGKSNGESWPTHPPLGHF